MVVSSADRLLTQAELAELIGVSQSTVSKWSKRPDFPISDSPPWNRDDVNTVRTWAKDIESATGKSRDVARAIQQAKLAVLVKQAQILDQKLGTMKKELVNKDEVETDESRRILHLRDTLLGLGDEAAPWLVGKNQETIRRSLVEKMTDVCLMYSGEIEHPRGMAEIVNDCLAQ